MIECCVVCCSLEGGGHGVAEEDGEDAVAAEVAFCFVEGWRVLVGGMRKRETSVLSMMRVFCMNVGFERRGSRKPLAHAPATVTEVSWPLFAVKGLEGRTRDFGRDLLMFGVINIH